MHPFLRAPARMFWAVHKGPENWYRPGTSAMRLRASGEDDRVIEWGVGERSIPVKAIKSLGIPKSPECTSCAF